MSEEKITARDILEIASKSADHHRVSRPIPEGVEAPHPNAVILGWGEEFIVPDHVFNGWMSFSAKGQWLVAIGMKGVNIDCLYAADRDSEVARLNYPEIPESSTDKDALIRELVGALKGMLDQELPSDLWMRHCVEAERVLALARTTCPEAFDGCSENSSS